MWKWSLCICAHFLHDWDRKKQNHAYAQLYKSISTSLHHPQIFLENMCSSVFNTRDDHVITHSVYKYQFCMGNGVYIVFMYMHHLCTWYLSKCLQANMTLTLGREIASTSGGRNLGNPADSATTTRQERNIPEVICKLCLAGGSDHRQKPSEVFLIDEARPGQVSESDCGPACCKHSLMEGSDPGAHMHGCTRTHTCEHLNVHVPAHTAV